MAMVGHRRSVAIPMRPWAARAAMDRRREANHRMAWGRDGARCRSDPRSPGPTASGSWTRSRVRCSSRPTAPARPTSSRPWTTSATGTRVTPTRPTRARGPRTAIPCSPLVTAAAARRGTSAAPGTGYQPQPVTPPPGSGQDIWPVTGAQEALPDTGPQPAIRGGSPLSSATAYPDQWYGSPRLDDRAGDDVRPSRSPDPRLVGMTYGELRYDDQEPGQSSYDEPLDDESWYQELRRSAPAYPQTPGGPPGPGGGPQRRAEPPGPGPAFGQQSGYSPAPDRAPGHAQSRRDGAGPQSPQGPQMSAGRPQP